MPRLDVHPTPGRRRLGYVVNVQAELLDHLASRVVVPLLPEAAAAKAISELDPVFEIEGGPRSGDTGDCEYPIARTEAGSGVACAGTRRDYAGA